MEAASDVDVGGADGGASELDAGAAVGGEAGRSSRISIPAISPE